MTPALPFPDPPLTDGVVALRPRRDADAPTFASWSNDAEIVRWTGVPAEYDVAAARAWMVVSEEMRLAGEALHLLIAAADSGATLGSCDIRRPDPYDPGLGEIGYLLVEAARGRGLATRAVRLLVTCGFGALNMGRIQALVHPENPRSAAVLERAGFRREGVLRGYRPGDPAREDRLLFAVLSGDLIATS